MNSAVVFGAPLWSGYALPACHPENGSPRPNRQRFHLSTAETCPDKAGHLYTDPSSIRPFLAGKIAQSLNVLLTPDGGFALALATEAGTEGPYIIRPVAAAFLREKLRV